MHPSFGLRGRAAILALVLALGGCSSTVDGRSNPLSTAATSTASSSSKSSSSKSSSTTTSSTDDGEEWQPTEAHQDPSVDIPDIYVGDPALYENRAHVVAPARVAYDRFPPVGGPHDPVWAACDSVVYPVPVRNENMVHALEHGAVWIAYNPDTLPAAGLETLSMLVKRTPYLVMTPYPDLQTPISLQFWAHQLALDSADDPRIGQFIIALLQNPYLTPEPSATCSQPTFDVANPPPLVAAPPGPDATPMEAQPSATSTS